MTTTPKLGIPLISSQQSQPEVTHNTMVVLLQALAGGAIDQRNAAPASPVEGACYIVGAAPSGAFVGHANAIAVYFGGWNFVPGYDDDGVVIPMSAAQNGLSIFNNATGELWAWSTSSWLVVTGGSGASRLIDLTDVTVSETATEDGDALTWDQALGQWVARPIVIPSDGVPALKDLSDVAISETSTIDGDFLAWDDALQKWVPTPINLPSDGVPALSDLSDVSIVSPQDGDVLTFNSLTGKWDAEPGGSPVQSSGAGVETAKAFSVYLAVAQNIADATYATILFDTVQEDPWHWYNAATGRFTPKKKGVWCFFGGFQGDTGSALAYVIEKLRKNGTDLVASAFGPIPALPTLSNECYSQVIVRMNGTTDYVDVQGYVTGTGGSNHVRAGTQTFFGGFFIGD